MEVFRNLKREVKASFTATEEILNVVYTEDGIYESIVANPKKGK